MGGERGRPDERAAERDAAPARAVARPAAEDAGPERTALALQQQVGNRAVQRLVASGRIQRYAIQDAAQNWQGLGKAMKVSDDGKMAVQDIALYPEGMGRAHQEFYATQDVIGSATNTLAGLKSVYSIQQGAALPNPAPGNLPMFKVDVENKVLGAAATPLNCDDNTRQFLGLETALPEQMSRDQLTTHLTHKPLVGKRRGMDVEHAPEEGFDTAKNAAIKEITGKTGPKGTDKYRELAQQKKEEAARKLGINQFAQAGQGGAYGVWGDTQGLRHFAPILAKSGGDEVALEAHVHNQTTQGPAKGEIAAGDRADYNPEWYFQMYGPVKTAASGMVDDQSFYGRHAAQFPNDQALTVIPFHKLPATLPPDATAAEHHKLVLDAVARNRLTATNAKAKFPEEAAVAAAVVVLERDPAQVPTDPAQLGAWLRTWAAAIDAAMGHIDPTLRANAAAFAQMKLRAALRNTRRYAVMIG